MLRRRRRVVAGASVVGTGLLGASLATKPGSWRFYALTLGTAGTWVVGGLCSSPWHYPVVGDGEDLSPPPIVTPQPIVTPIAMGIGAFALFYGAALIARRVPFLNKALISIMKYSHQGSPPLVLATTLANAIGEELFFRGAAYAAAGTKHPRSTSTVAYMAVTTATRNPSLVLASGFMGALFAVERGTTGSIQAPLLTHVTWSALMLRFLPPLFRPSHAG